MIYEGNFIRNIIKINKICQDILKICEITKNDKLKKKVEQIEPLLLRDIVTIESLYIYN
jgi:superfamily II RNA helicase